MMDIEQGYRSIRQTDYAMVENRASAIAQVLHLAEPGDCVLIAGKGHNAYQEFEDTIVPFDDREYAREALELNGINHTLLENLEPELAGR